jgi:hypothetical protein
MEHLSLLERARLASPDGSDPEHMERIAAQTISELGQEPPVDLDVVASYRDIAEIRVEQLPVSGALGPEDGHLVMHLRSSDSPRRRRFTGFHEVGHSFQPGYREELQFRCLDPSPAPREGADPEVLADRAAAELLLPAAFFAADVEAAAFGFESVKPLADRYEASVQATLHRYLRFWPEPVLLLIMEQGLRSEELEDPDARPRLRVKGVHAFGDWPFIPRNKSAAEGGVLLRALQGETIDEQTDLSELGIDQDSPLEISARSFTYPDSDGIPRRRVCALYRMAANA